jgi:hypothetical protein
MAISYLSNINLNNNELKSFIVDNLAAAPTVNVADQGNLIYNTALGALQYNTGTNTWVTISSGMVTWDLVGDSGGAQAIGDGQSASVLGESGFISTTSAATRKVTITMDDNAPSNIAGTVAFPASIGYNKKGQIIAVTPGGQPITGFSIEGNGADAQSITNGDTIDFVSNTGLTIVTSSVDADNKAATINLALQDLPDMTQTWATGDEFIILDNTNHSGTDKQRRKASNEIPLNILGTPTANLAMGSNKITGLTDPTLAQDAATKQYVDTAVVGSLQIKGGFNANTGAIDATPVTSNLTYDDLPVAGDERVAIAIGDFYVVTTAGNFFGNAATPLTVGDQVICNTAAGAGLSAESDFVIVQSDTDLATATTVGLASFPTAGGTTITGAGAVSLTARAGVAGSYGAVTKSLQLTADGKGIITGIADANIAIPSTQVTDFCAAVETCVGTGLNYSANIGDGTAVSYIVNHALGTRDVMVQVYDTASPYDTVICDVERTDANNVTLSTTTALPTAGARVLISVV